jgi:hypothetical protein
MTATSSLYTAITAIAVVLSFVPLFLALPAVILAAKSSDRISALLGSAVLIITVYSLVVALSGFLARNAGESYLEHQRVNDAQQAEDADAE